MLMESPIRYKTNFPYGSKCVKTKCVPISLPTMQQNQKNLVKISFNGPKNLMESTKTLSTVETNKKLQLLPSMDKYIM